MSGGEYEPKDSRNVTGDMRKSWRARERPEGDEYEPKDSRHVEGTASSPDGRWTDKDGKPPRGVPQEEPMNAEDAAAAAAARVPRD